MKSKSIAPHGIAIGIAIGAAVGIASDTAGVALGAAMGFLIGKRKEMGAPKKLNENSISMLVRINKDPIT